MNYSEVMSDLQQKGSEQTKKIFTRHGAREPYYGVKVADLKILQKKIKTDHHLALQLFDSGNSDAMYLAGMIADPKLFQKDVLQNWAEKAYWYMISEFTVAGVTAESRFGWELASEWINSDKENIASAGWATYSWLVSLTPNNEIDVKLIETLLLTIKEKIHSSQNRVRYTMNGFIISVGAYIPDFKETALKAADFIGKVKVFMGQTSCKVPDARPYIENIYSMGRAGKKRKSALC